MEKKDDLVKAAGQSTDGVPAQGRSVEATMKKEIETLPKPTENTRGKIKAEDNFMRREYTQSQDSTSDSEQSVNPMAFPMWKKLMASASMCLLAFMIGFESSIGSALVVPITDSFHVTPSIGLLNVTLYLIGWCSGTALFGPLSEVYGRRYPIAIGTFLFVIFQIPTGEAENIEAILICRLLSGFFGSSPLVMVHSIFSDIWQPLRRDLTLCCFTTSLFTGACLGPIAGTFLIAKHGRGWRWVEYTTVIMSAVIWLTIFFIPESSAPRLLEQRHSRTKKRRSSTQRDLERARQIDRNRKSARRLIDVWVRRPFVMLFTEPILFLNTLHAALAMGVLYVGFQTFQVPWTETRNWSLHAATLPPFVALTLGIIVGGLASLCFITSSSSRVDDAEHPSQPEQRLIPVIIGAFLLPSGLFWFAWTDTTTIHWFGQAISCFIIGVGIMLICQQGEAYSLEVYQDSPYMNSVITATIFLRSLFAAAFTMASRTQYASLHFSWATSIWGFITMAAIPIPILLYVYGGRMRHRSRYIKRTSANVGAENDGREHRHS